MRISYSLGSLLTIDEVLECAKISEKHSPDTIWIPETWGMENFTMLSAISQKNNYSKIGSSIINIFSRSPSLIAMGAATVDTISNGRLVIGLGTSSETIVEDFHGNDFKRPVSRMKEYVEIIKLVLTGKKINEADLINKLLEVFNKISQYAAPTWKILNDFKVSNFNGVPYIYEIIMRIGLEKLNTGHMKKITQAGGRLDKKIVLDILNFCSKSLA